MAVFDFILDKIAQSIGKRIQGQAVHGAYSDSGQKGSSYSVESMVCETLANLMAMGFQMPCEGDSARALFLDHVSDQFVDKRLSNAVSMAFMTGDCLVVPHWDGRSVQNVLVPAESFAILGASGDELTSVLYVVDEKVEQRSGVRITLCRLIELVERGGQKLNHYSTMVFRDGKVDSRGLEAYPDWAAANESDWFIPGVDRLLVGRYKSFTLNPNSPNAQKGAPICYGASEPIREIHYLTQAMHNEFALSEKLILASKAMFKKEYERDADGNIVRERLVLPKGRERLFMNVSGRGLDDEMQQWAPTIQLQPYLDALEAQCREVEKAVGVSSGILSNLNEMNYQNVDNVRKSTIKTQSFINTARTVCEQMLENLVYAWNSIANYYEITPVGDYQVEYKWNNDYINSFCDQQNAILAGEAIGATDAVDYRMFVMGESPEVAKSKVAEIQAGKSAAELVEI